MFVFVFVFCIDRKPGCIVKNNFDGTNRNENFNTILKNNII